MQLGWYLGQSDVGEALCYTDVSAKTNVPVFHAVLQCHYPKQMSAGLKEAQ